MTIELYAIPEATQPEHPELPISNTVGELPEQEPTLDLGELLGSFSSEEEALAFINERVATQDQQVVDTHSAPFNDYTHVEWLTITIQTQDQQTRTENYYLVTDEGY
ncbi:hypothetical protein [Spirosoma koreense]